MLNDIAYNSPFKNFPGKNFNQNNRLFLSIIVSKSKKDLTYIMILKFLSSSFNSANLRVIFISISFVSVVYMVFYKIAEII